VTPQQQQLRTGGADRERSGNAGELMVTAYFFVYMMRVFIGRRQGVYI
jgi:hypothetical protein